jgi:putative glycosyltransferase (TIGR04348 family)
MLGELGHRCRVLTEDDGGPADVFIALHAARSAEAVARHRERRTTPLVVVLTGTDLYRDLPSSADARRSLDLADALVVLQPLALERLAGIDASWAAKARVIWQSVPPVTKPPPRKRTFDVCVVGHLRDEKDPLRAALASRRLPTASRIRVLQIGAALTPAWARRARREAEINPRYRWLGELPRHQARRWLGRSRLMVLSSRMEGGAHVIGEAVVGDTPILASRIDGTTGMLGPRHPGLFEVEDTDGLARLMERAETEPAFLERLADAGRRWASRFSPPAERQALAALLRGLPSRSNPTG